MTEPNPFEVLQLDPSASEAEIIQQAGRLRQRAVDDEALTAIRQAVRELTASPERRALHAQMTYPSPCHDTSAVDRLANAHRRPVATSNESDVPPLADLDLNEIGQLLRPMLIQELRIDPLLLEMPPIEETDEEIDRQTIEAWWQVLPYQFET